jgi:methylamine utilization protein MauE
MPRRSPSFPAIELSWPLMWALLAGPFLAAGVLLVAAGVPKLADPMPLVRAVRQAGLPTGRTSIRLVALAETAVGVYAVAAPGRASALLTALAYLVFTAFVARALARGSALGSCGCFGKPDTPPTRTHLVVTGAIVALAAAIAVDPPAHPWASFDATGLTTLAFAGVLAFLTWMVLAVLPGLSPRVIRAAATSPNRGD